MSMIKEISNENYNNKTTLNDLKETIASISSTPDGELKYGNKVSFTKSSTKNYTEVAFAKILKMVEKCKSIGGKHDPAVK